MCRYIKNNISFLKNDIVSIISSMKNKLHSSSVRIIANNDDKFNLFKTDLPIISKFLASLGGGDVDYELNNLN
jgi:hypothetical protein